MYKILEIIPAKNNLRTLGFLMTSDDDDLQGTPPAKEQGLLQPLLANYFTGLINSSSSLKVIYNL